MVQSRHHSSGGALSAMLLMSVLFLVSQVIINVEARNKSYPITYTRGRYEYYSLNIMRSFRPKSLFDEKQVTLEVNEICDCNKTREVKLKVYENDKIEADSFNMDDLIFEAIDRSYKSRLIQSNIFTYDDPKDRIIAADRKLISDNRCTQELNYLDRKLRDVLDLSDMHKNGPTPIELLAFFDSYGSEEPGLLTGNYYMVGDWRECYRRQIVDRNPDNYSQVVAHFTGRYCIASLRSRKWTSKIKSKVDEMHQANYFKWPGQPYDYARFFRIQVGICLPKSCDSSAIDSHRDIIRRLTIHRMRQPIRFYDLFDLFCIPDESSELRQLDLSGWLFVVLSLIWCSAIIFITLIDNKYYANKERKKRVKNWRDKLVSAVSLKRNWKRLTTIKGGHQIDNKVVNQAESCEEHANEHLAVKMSTNDLLFLNSIKILAMPVVFLGHLGMMIKMLDRFANNLYVVDNQDLVRLVSSSIYMVDWYFSISGFLCAYLMFVTKKVYKYNSIRWLYTIFHRYWRLAPGYIFLFWFSRSVFQYISYGPVWDYGVNNMTIRRICHRESWWTPITLTANMKPFHDTCILPAWYLASDMQFYLITPPILVILAKSPFAGWVICIAMIASNIAFRIHRLIVDPKVESVELLRPRLDSVMRHSYDISTLYLYPQYRVGSYLIGILGGHYCFMVLSGEWTSFIYPESRLPKQLDTSHLSRRLRNRLRALTYYVFVFIMIGFFGVSYLEDVVPLSGESSAKMYCVLLFSMAHVISALSLAMVSICIMFGQCKLQRRWMSHPLWTILSRINYFILITQVELIYLIFQSEERVVQTSGRQLIRSLFLLICLCVILSFVMTILLEYPLGQLEHQFIGLRILKRLEKTHNSTIKQNWAENSTGESVQLVNSSNAVSSSPEANDKNQSQNSKETDKVDGCNE